MAEHSGSDINIGDLAERVNLSTNLENFAERVSLGTNLEDLAERVSLGISIGDLVERMNSDTNLGDLAERVNLGTNLEDLAERVNSGTNLGDLVERVNSGTNLGDLSERVRSGTNLGDLVERVSSGINLGDLAERVNSGTNFGDLVERVTSGINLGDLAERVNSGTSFRDLAERVGMTSLDSSSNVSVVSSAGSGGTSPAKPEVSSSRASSGPPSPVDARVLRDLEVMKAGHDLDTAVTEGSLAAIREWYNIPVEYGMHVLLPGQRPYSSDAPGVCISVDALEARLRQVAPNSWRYLIVFLGECRGAGIVPTQNLFMACFRLCKSHGGYYLTTRIDFKVSGAPSNNKGWKERYLCVSCPNWGFRLDWSVRPISNVPPYLSEEESILVGRLKGIVCSSRAIKEVTKLWLVEAGLSPAFRDRMDLGDLRGMPKVSGGKTLVTQVASPAREVRGTPSNEALRSSSAPTPKRPFDSSTPQSNDSTRGHKRVKTSSGKHKSRRGEGGSRSHSRGKEPAKSAEELKAPVELAEETVALVFRRPKSMRDLCRTSVRKDDEGYYALYMSDLDLQDLDNELRARWELLKNSTKVWDDPRAGRSSKGDFSIRSWRGNYIRSCLRCFLPGLLRRWSW
ncbi:hypothetical protein BHM03_00001620 [Ensete ventricosum]|nr:hypothetical protein BHM03_00001620 [Ensete ventricosum]